MEKIITTIVTQLLSKLSNDRIYYTQKDLSESGYPQFLIKRITVHLMRELRNEFNLPGEEWLNRGSDELLAEWAELQRTIKREIHLPAFLAEEIVAKSVKECIGMAIQPRKVIPELLFDERDELDSNQLTERSSSITVNRFLVWSIVRYMEKKNRVSLNISDAARVIESIESKLVESYHPLNWLSLVKPLYELSGSNVHSDLFRRFFEHRGKNHLAKEFDLINDEINESRFIEILSSPNSIHVDGYKDDQQNLFQVEGKEEKVVPVEVDKDLNESQDELIEDNSDTTPIFQSFTDESVEELDEWVEDEKNEKVPELPVDEEEEQAIELKSNDEEQSTDLEEDDEKEVVSRDEEEEQAIELKSDDEEQSTDLEQDDVKEVVPGDVEEEQGIDLEEDDEEEESVTTLHEEDEKKLISASDEGEGIVAVQDEELVAPWEDDEDEGDDDNYSFITHDDTPVTELKDLYSAEQEEMGEDEQTDLIDDEIETIKREEPAPNADLLEIEDEDSSLLNRFMFDESDDEETLGDMESDENKKVTTIYDELNLVRNNKEPETMDLFGSFKTPEMDEETSSFDPVDENSELEPEEPETIRKFSDLVEPDSGDDSDESEVPMWRSFLERDEDDVKSAFQFDDKSVDDQYGSIVEDSEEELDEVSEEELDEDGFIEEPIYDFTQKEPDLDEKIGDLSNWMKDVREKFIEDLFGDSEDAYEQALADIMEFDDWKSASKYIEKEVFTRNRIDVYDELAVDFTDRLHSYFLDNKS